tara:strand:+ start:1556 stop:1798 length:243 start_codon:yes stop_codon:yes gene_type:complete
MSRYSKTNNNITLNYGWDHALGYWYDLIDESILDDEDNPKLLEEKSSFIDRLNRGDFLTLLDKWQVPDNHRLLAAMDLPF